MSEQKKYFGGAKEIHGNFGAFHRISFSQKDLEEMLNNLNSKGYINLNMNKRREPSQYGQTHSLTLDTWEPENTGQNRPDRQDYNPPQTTNQQHIQQAHAQVPQVPNFDDVNDPEDCPF